MATIEQFQERLRLAVRQALQKVLADGDLPEAEKGEARFTTIETLALAAGDAVSLEVFEQHWEPAVSPACAANVAAGRPARAGGRIQLAECALGPRP